MSSAARSTSRRSFTKRSTSSHCCFAHLTEFFLIWTYHLRDRLIAEGAQQQSSVACAHLAVDVRHHSLLEASVVNLHEHIVERRYVLDLLGLNERMEVLNELWVHELVLHDQLLDRDTS